MNRDDHINHVLDTRFRPLMQEAVEIIEALKPGERIPATVLAGQIAVRHAMTTAQIYPLILPLWNNGYPGRVIKRGAKGGIENPLPKDNK